MVDFLVLLSSSYILSMQVFVDARVVWPSASNVLLCYLISLFHLSASWDTPQRILFESKGSTQTRCLKVGRLNDILGIVSHDSHVSIRSLPESIKGFACKYKTKSTIIDKYPFPIFRQSREPSMPFSKFINVNVRIEICLYTWIKIVALVWIRGKMTIKSVHSVILLFSRNFDFLYSSLIFSVIFF